MPRYMEFLVSTTKKALWRQLGIEVRYKGGGELHPAPTHWRPLPAPPVTEGTEGPKGGSDGE